MKRFITLVLFLFAVAVPFQRVQADNLPSSDFGPLASLIGEWQGKDPEVKNPALPGGAFVNQEGMCLRFATGCHSSPLFRAGHLGRSW